MTAPSPAGDRDRTAAADQGGVMARTTGGERSHYESDDSVEPAHITTFRELRRARRLGFAAADEPTLYEDFFRDTTRSDPRRNSPRR
jgi:hypothetical protein